MCKKGLGKVKNRNTLLWIVILLTVYKNLLCPKSSSHRLGYNSGDPFGTLLLYCWRVALGSMGLWRALLPSPDLLTSALAAERQELSYCPWEESVLPSGRLPQRVVVDPTISLQERGRKEKINGNDVTNFICVSAEGTKFSSLCSGFGTLCRHRTHRGGVSSSLCGYILNNAAPVWFHRARLHHGPSSGSHLLVHGRSTSTEETLLAGFEAVQGVEQNHSRARWIEATRVACVVNLKCL